MKQDDRMDPTHWAVILGGSSGFGLASAQKLARHGMNVVVVHRDRRGAMKRIEEEFDVIRQTGVDFWAYNGDALDPASRSEIIAGLAERLGERGRVRVLLHSIAFGNLRLLAPQKPGPGPALAGRAALAAELGIDEAELAQKIEAAFQQGPAADALARLAAPPVYDADAVLLDEDFARTVYSMGTSLASWVRELHGRALFASDARVLSLTSEGSSVAWKAYAAVAAAKSALESVARAIAVEYAPHGIRSNVIQAGVTDTPAMRLIPGSLHLKAETRLRNPFGRLTEVSDVADVVYLLARDEARWINGTIVRVDGGEFIAR